MKISIDDFGGNKDNYYNFKLNYKAGVRGLSFSRRYVNSFFRGSNLDKLNDHLWHLNGLLDEVEFED